MIEMGKEILQIQVTIHALSVWQCVCLTSYSWGGGVVVGGGRRQGVARSDQE